MANGSYFGCWKGQMTDLASRSRLLAIVMTEEMRVSCGLFLRGHISNAVEHHGGRAFRAAELHSLLRTNDRAKMVRELGRDGPFDRPVAGIMYSRRHLIRNEIVMDNEELHRKDTDIVESFENFFQIALRCAL